MHHIHLSESITFSVPSRMDELTKGQLRKLMWMVSLPLDNLSKSKLMVLIQSLSLPFWKRLRFQFFYFFQANVIERADILFCTQSFFEFDRLTEQKIKKIGGTFVLLHGPESGLANCTFWEFIKAEKYYLNYLSTQNKEWLNKLIATLYRPQRYNYNKYVHDDIRMPLSDQRLRFHMKIVERLDIETKNIILKWFDSCRNQLALNFPLVFKKPELKNPTSTNPLEIISQAGGSKGGGWLQLISELAGSMDNYEKIGNTNLIIALTDISHRIKKSQEAKAQLKSKRKK